MEKTYMKYMKQGSGTDYEMKKGPEKTKKAPTPGWITYDMNEYNVEPISSTDSAAYEKKQKAAMEKKYGKYFKAALTECNAIKKLLPSIQQDIKNRDDSGVTSAARAIKFSVERILKAMYEVS